MLFFELVKRANLESSPAKPTSGLIAAFSFVKTETLQLKHSNCTRELTNRLPKTPAGYLDGEGGEEKERDRERERERERESLLRIR